MMHCYWGLFISNMDCQKNLFRNVLRILFIFLTIKLLLFFFFLVNNPMGIIYRYFEYILNFSKIYLQTNKRKKYTKLFYTYSLEISPHALKKKVKIKKEYIKCTIGDLVSLHSFRFSPKKSITTLVRVNLYTYQHIKHWQFANMLYASKEFIL